MTNRHLPISAYRIATSAVLIFLTGCATRTPFKLPESRLPETWRQGAVTEQSLGSAQLAVVPAALLQDTQLRSLLAEVEDSNQELAAIAQKVRKAQMEARLAGNALWPWPNPLVTAKGTRLEGYNLNVAAPLTYEVDVWNKLRTMQDIASWEAQATDEDRRKLRLELLAAASDLYFRLGWLNDRIRVNAKNLNNARRVLTLVQAEYTYGKVSALELTAARQSQHHQQASLAALVHDRVQARNALGVLGDGRDLLVHEPDALPTYDVAPLPAGLPASLLSKRSDLRAAELRLRGALASVDMARVSLYPALTLDVSSLQRALSNPVGTLTATLALPFVNVGKAQLMTASAQAEFEAASLTFQHTLRKAFAEVDDALSSGAQLRHAQTHLESSLEDARIAERLYEARYYEGAVALRDWIDAQNKRHDAESAVMENRYHRYENAVVVLKALGASVPVGPTQVSGSNAS